MSTGDPTKFEGEQYVRDWADYWRKRALAAEASGASQAQQPAPAEPATQLGETTEAYHRRGLAEAILKSLGWSWAGNEDLWVAPATAEPVAIVYRGGSAFGWATVLQRWEAGANALPDGEHKLYAAAAVQPPVVPLTSDEAEAEYASWSKNIPRPYNAAAQKALNERHCAEPQPGDYWHEMFTPYHVVLAVKGDTVTICDRTKPSGPNHFTFDITQTRKVTRAEHRALVAYRSIPGFCADVVVDERALAFVEEYNAVRGIGSVPPSDPLDSNADSVNQDRRSGGGVRTDAGGQSGGESA